jgi:FixJ family two-component response regulator
MASLSRIETPPAFSSPVPIIHIVDDDRSCRAATARLLTTAGYEVLVYASAADFLLARVSAVPGCILLDIRMPRLSGLDLQKFLALQDEPPPVIFLTGYGNVPTTVRAMKAGAEDVLTKPVKRDILLQAVRKALAAQAERSAVREQIRSLQERYGLLTSREREVFDGVVAGKPNKQIALELGASERTIKAHRACVMEKMHATSIAELVHVAERLQNGISARPHAP